MIKGIGTDIVSIARIRRMIEKYGNQFLNKIFTQNEIKYCKEKAAPAVHLSGRWAAKESFYKALPFDCQKISGWKSIEIVPEDNCNKPIIKIVDTELNSRMQKYEITKFNLSISHEKEFCIAIVIME
jgi:holo-[acyl-carrier protein] synthase